MHFLWFGLVFLAGAGAPVARLGVQSGACLQPVDSAQLASTYESFLRNAFGLSDPAVVAALVIQPTFSPARVLSVRRAQDGRRVLRVTQLERTVWAPVLKRLQALQGASGEGASVRPPDDQQLRELALAAARSTTVERDLDLPTADLVARLWHALTRRVRGVRSEPVISDGTRYEFWAGGRAGTIEAPADGSLLQEATRAAERLVHLAEAPAGDDAATLTDIRGELKRALERSWRNEPCVQRTRR